jgi:hypothetical protein
VHGRITLEAVAPALQAAIAWVREDAACQRVGLITMRLLRLYLEAAWTGACDEISAEDVEQARATFGPVLQTWSGEILFGHYGAVRGLNTMADVDALITLGDPWPNVGDARNDAAFLGLGGAWEARLEAMCRAELEQAHGRIRAVHRTRPGRALHVGTVLPSGYGWTGGGVEFRSMSPASLHVAADLSPAQFASLVEAVGGVCEAARRLGCSRKSVARYCSGSRPVPRAIAVVLENQKTSVKRASGDRPLN